MEDALISPIGFMILSGAGLIEGSENAPIKVHVAETTQNVYYDTTDKAIYVITNEPLSGDANADIYVLVLDESGSPDTEPYIGSKAKAAPTGKSEEPWTTAQTEGRLIQIKDGTPAGYKADFKAFSGEGEAVKNGLAVMVDYYTDKKSSSTMQVEITPDKFGGNYYLEASTLFRDTNGVDMPAEFIIPNCKIQSNFTFTMASSGDPSTFTFTLDAFPDYTKFDRTKKVLCAIQIVSDPTGSGDDQRKATAHDYVGE